MMRCLTIFLVVIGLVASSPRASAAEEIALFDKSGAATAYIDTDDGLTIYLWKGQPVAYLDKGSVWGFSGEHLGWFEKGIIRDHDGYVVGCIKGVVSMLYQLEPLKGLQKLAPLKGLQELEPLKPLDRLSWSTTPLSLFLAAGSR